MRKKLNIVLLFIISVLLSFGAGCTDTGRFAVSGKTGTLGLGGEFTAGIATNVNARVGLNMFDLSLDGQEIEDVEFDLGVDLSSFSALVDWHIFSDSFRVSSGLISMDNSVDLKARGASGVLQDIGDGSYDWSEIGTLSGSIESDDVAPYLGIGWGNPLTHSKRWGFTCDFGVAFTGSPDISLTADGILASDAAFQAELAELKGDIEDFFDSFKLYPVMSLSFFYRF